MFLNFFKFKLPAASGPCPDSSFSILLCKGIVKDFFKILDAGRRDITDVAVGAGQRAARCGNPVKCFVAKSPVAKPCHIYRLSISPIVRSGLPFRTAPTHKAMGRE